MTASLEAPVVEVPSVDVLTADDRCDRCGAQAYMLVGFSSGLELLFCAHHAREHDEKLRVVAVKLIDETARLNSVS